MLGYGSIDYNIQHLKIHGHRKEKLFNSNLNDTIYYIVLKIKQLDIF